MHVIGTAGHVDHGKSTLVERLTGMDPDRFAEEKRRGLTIDLGFAWLALPSGNEIGIIDVPGHERFIRNMLAGAGGATICLFVVDSAEGWKPQSAEHLAILDVLGVDRGVVALTKIDLTDEATVATRRAEVENRLAHSSLRGAPVVPCSAATGEGMDELVARLDELVSAAPLPPDRGRPRLWVDRVFSIAGAGTVVTGTLGGGSLKIGDEVVIAPEGRSARIRSIQSHKKDVDEIGPGNRTALNLAGLAREGAHRGDAIVKAGIWPATRRVHALIRVLDPELSGQKHELREKGAHLLYAGTAESPVRIRLLEGDRISAGGSGLAQIELREPLPLERGDHFVLRDAGRILTFGGGEVIDPWPELSPRDAQLLPYLRSTTGLDGDSALRALVEAEGSVPIERALLRTRATTIGNLNRLGSTLVSKARLTELSGRVQSALEEHHSDNPLAKGLDREELRARMGIEDRGVFDDLLKVTAGIVIEGPEVRAEGHQVRYDDEQAAARLALIQALEADGINPPLTKELDASPELLRALAQAGEIVSVGDFYLTAAQVQSIRERVVAFITENGPATVAQIRDLLQTSRKYAVPLCEWLDQTGITRRTGNERVLGPRASTPGR